jgi:hypothetical protein
MSDARVEAFLPLRYHVATASDPLPTAGNEADTTCVIVLSALICALVMFVLVTRRLKPGLKGLSCFHVSQLLSDAKGSRARRRMYVRWCIPRGLFGKGCSRSGLPPSRILMFRERLMNRLCGLSCWLA